MDGMTPKSDLNFECRYCHRRYVKESTLAAHLCEPKRRWQQEKEVGVQLGLRAYIRFYEITQGSAKFKSYTDFVESPYYKAFVKFGRYLCDIRAVNTASYTEWLLKNNKKIDHWTKDSMYTEWLLQYLPKEAVSDALERSLNTMVEYAEQNSDLRNGFSDYFRYGNVNKVCFQISTGRISPWVIYNCDSGQEFLSQLAEDQINIVMPVINPDIWMRRLNDYPADVIWCKETLSKAGL